jgi:addiction module RelE/StbE family toxin
MKLIFTRAALGDLEAISEYISQDSPSAARRVAQRIRAAARRLSSFPFSGRVGLEPGTRELIVSRTAYVVVYRVSQTADAPFVEIVAIFHGSMDRIGGPAAEILRGRLK